MGMRSAGENLEQHRCRIITAWVGQPPESSSIVIRSKDKQLNNRKYDILQTNQRSQHCSQYHVFPLSSESSEPVPAEAKVAKAC